MSLKDIFFFYGKKVSVISFGNGLANIFVDCTLVKVCKLDYCKKIMKELKIKTNE
jgi:hypothetical protein